MPRPTATHGTAALAGLTTLLLLLTPAPRVDALDARCLRQAQGRRRTRGLEGRQVQEARSEAIVERQGPSRQEGSPGRQWTTGPSGLNGVIGATGPAGATTDNGATGANGTNGLAGPAGATGETGTQGSSGGTGTAGTTGATGPTGVTGTTGANGATGSAGPTGTNGATGTTGTTGGTGGAGATGPTGSAGAVSGYSAAQAVSNRVAFTSGTVGYSQNHSCHGELPAGNYVVNAKVELELSNTTPKGEVACNVSSSTRPRSWHSN